MRERIAVLCAALLFLLPACEGADDGRSGFRASLFSTAPPGGTAEVIWIAAGPRSGGRVQVDILARDIVTEFDGFDLELIFDPIVVQVESITGGGVLSGCTSLPVLMAENASNGNANGSGSLLYSEAISGVSPPPCTLTGEVTLARAMFRARSRGQSPLSFAPYNGNPASPAGSRVFRRDPVIPDVGVLFFDAGAFIEVKR